ADINRLSTGRLPMYISRSRNQNNYSFFQVSPPKLSAFTCLDKPDHLNHTLYGINKKPRIHASTNDQIPPTKAVITAVF
ncbi:MAG: hypothetical protein Q8Q94_01480, partial [bacterium]|nr:hypothetical protein [bacterium]MDZ4285954.1 hypothetical protein [Candidatus Sungbacteria bacterium]